MNCRSTAAFIRSPRQLLQSDTGDPHFALDPLTYRCLLSLSPAADFAEPRPPRHSIVPWYSYRLCADDSFCLSGASHHNSAPRGFLQGRHRPSAQNFPEDAGPYGSGFAGTSAGSASYVTHPVLVETEGSSSGLASRTNQGRRRNRPCTSTA